ncbi:Lipopolysaccharide assembly protein B [termite gut metagenome]|uniref:Lipopolysaccharide assembly protein B n=1 Tax=termite gut metagenome TaxID=433724 RepID=A0A5J4SF90_9ZZZZ
MNNANTLPEEENQELIRLIAQYESAKSDKQNVYLDADQILEIAEWYELHDRADDAYDILMYGMSWHPNHAGILTAYAYSHLDRGELEEAKRIAALIDDEFAVETKLLRVELLLMEDKLPEAETILNTLADEEEASLYLNIAGLYIQTDHPSEGLSWLQKAAMLDPDDEELIETVAECCHSIGKNEEAAYYFNRLIDKQPYSADYWVGLAKVCFAQEQYDKSIEACDFALVCDANSGDAHLFKAYCLYQLESYEESIKEYKEVLAIGNFLAEYIYSYIGSCYNEMQEWEQACAYYKKALQGTNELDDVKKADVYNNLSTCYYRMGRFEEAHDLCQTMEILFPDFLDSYLLDGRMYSEEDEKEKAGECWDKILSKKTTDIYALTQVGEYCLDTDDLIRAKKALEKAFSLNPDNMLNNMFLVLTYVRLKDWRNLLKIHRHLDISPSNSSKLKSFIREFYEGDESLSSEMLEAIGEFEEKIKKKNKRTSN